MIAINIILAIIFFVLPWLLGVWLSLVAIVAIVINVLCRMCPRFALWYIPREQRWRERKQAKREAKRNKTV